MLLRNELDTIWGLQGMTDLVPSQADSLFRQAQSNIKLATETADLGSYPTPYLPPAAPIPRPALTSPTDAATADVSGQAQGIQSAHAEASQQCLQGQQNVQSGGGDLYAHAEHGVTRSPGRAQLNVRQQQALESGLLRLSQPRSNSRDSNTATAVAEPASEPVQTSLITPSVLSKSSSQSSSSSPAAAPSPPLAPPAPSASPVPQPDQLLLERMSSNSEASSSSSALPAPPQSRQSDSGSSAADSSPSGTAPRSPRGTWFRSETVIQSCNQQPDSRAQGPKRVVRGRSARKALAAQAAADARAKSSNKGRSRFLDFLTPEQQQVSAVWL